MKGCLKLALVAVGLVLITVALGVLGLVLQVDTYAKGAVERTLRYVLKAEITIDRMRLRPLQEQLEMQGVTVFNPPSFKAGPALTADRIALRFDLRTLFVSAPKLRQVLLQGLHVNLRYNLGEGSNIGALAKQAAADAETPSPEAPRSARRGFVVEEVRCEAGKISLSTNLVPVASAGLNLAPFTLHDFGNNPINVGQITAVLLRSVIRETLTLKGLLSPVVSLLHKEASEAGP